MSIRTCLPLTFATLTACAVITASANPGPAVVVDGDTLKVSGISYRLHGIDAPEAGQTCKGRKADWPCGKRATERLVELTAGKSITCVNRGPDDYDRVLAVCAVDGTDINATMVREGLAWAYVKYSSDYVAQEAAARTAGAGVWQADTESPWEFRRRRWTAAEQEAPDGCPIKGNISPSGEAIYHAPWSPWYGRTRINPAKGERWFCSEREALDAGWRAPVWGQ